MFVSIFPGVDNLNPVRDCSMAFLSHYPSDFIETHPATFMEYPVSELPSRCQRLSLAFAFD